MHDGDSQLDAFEDVVWRLEGNVIYSMNRDETISASSMIHKRNKMQAIDVVVDFEEFKLSAEKFIWDLDKQQIQAEGKVLFNRPETGQEVQAESMNWNFKEDDAEFSKVRIRMVQD